MKKQIQFEKLTKIANDGLVFLGLSDNLDDFKKIINEELNSKEIGTGNFEDKFKNSYVIKTKDDRRDNVFEFAEKPTIDMGKLAIWRIQLNGFASWISDYIVNHRCDFDLEPLDKDG